MRYLIAAALIAIPSVALAQSQDNLTKADIICRNHVLTEYGSNSITIFTTLPTTIDFHYAPEWKSCEKIAQMSAAREDARAKAAADAEAKREESDRRFVDGVASGSIK